MKSRRKNIILLFPVIIPLLLIIAGYLGITLYFNSHFMFGSYINGTDYTGKTVGQAEQNMKKDIHNYTLEIAERGALTEYIQAEDIGLDYVSDGSIQELLDRQNPFLWPAAYFRKENYEMAATTIYDPDMLRSAVEDLDCFDEELVRRPVDASYEYGEGRYHIVAEDIGDLLKDDEVYELVKAAVEQGDTRIDLEESDCYEKPAVTQDYEPLVRLVDTLNRYVGITVTYDFIDRTEPLTGEQIKEWLVVEDYEVSIDEKLVREYIDALSRKYNTFGKTREFETWNGTLVTVKGGDYGWLISRSVETEALIDIIKAGKSVKREPVYLQTAYCREENDIGSTYVEINLTAQHMWFFKDGECLVDTPVVTGNVSKDYGTPAGVYQITYKERNATLNGEDYSTPVSYWMPFYYNVGIHDAPWRNKFGGEIYKKSGSHGCVNTPPDNARIIYENIEAKVPVVVYKKKLRQEVMDQLNGIKDETRQ